MKTAALILVLGLILAAACIGAFGAFRQYGHLMSVHGWIALALGTVLTLGLGAGLMALSFYSARRGYDDSVAADPAAPDLDEPVDPPH